jgi:hypothetical protein
VLLIDTAARPGRLTAMNLEELIPLLVKVKPSLGSRAIGPGDELVDGLGLDSLDFLQLSRQLSAATKAEVVLESWAAAERQRPAPRFTVESLLVHVNAARPGG